eukprot:m.143164 g.143164  ORF g.143164 m.143164 type:complete len:929 (+) comp16734_c0_seq2:49-2835(+)
MASLRWSTLTEGESRDPTPFFAFDLVDDSKESAASFSKLASPPFTPLHTLIKRESLFVAAEKLVVRDLYRDLNALMNKMMQVSRAAREMQWCIHLFSHNQLTWKEWEQRLVKQPEGPQYEFVECAQELGGSSGPYVVFVNALYRDPDAVAEFLIEMAYDESFAPQLDDLLRAVLFGLYGSFNQPADETAIVRVLEILMTHQLEAQESRPDNFLRKSSLFSRLFMIYLKDPSLDANTYLIASLREPIMMVLADDDLDLEIEPTNLWSRLTEAQRTELFGSDHSKLVMTCDLLLSNAEFKRLLDQVYDKLLGFCRLILTSLTANVPCLLFSIRKLCALIQKALQAKGCSPTQIRSALGDLLFVKFVMPAIATPEPYGIIIDTPITPTARRNLNLIARIMRDVCRAQFKATEPYMAPLHTWLKGFATNDIDLFFSRLTAVDVHNCKIDFPPNSVNNRGRRPVILLSSEELFLLQRCVGTCLGMDDERSPIRDAFKKLPKTFGNETEDSSKVLIVPHTGTPEQGSLLSEADVVALHRQQTGKPGSNLDSPLGEAAQKLRKVFAHMQFNPRYTYLNLVELLENAFLDAKIVGDNSMASEIYEASRCIKALPAELIEDQGKALCELIMAQYEERSIYVRYLVHAKESLLVTRDRLNRQTARMTGLLAVSRQYLNMMRVQQFWEHNEALVTQCVNDFRKIELLDEKSAFVNRRVNQLLDEMMKDPMWATVSASDKEESCVVLEKRFLSRIYKMAFFPHEADALKDQVFQQHIQNNLQYITPEHECLQISKLHMRECPWPAAQKALMRLNAYKTPVDKLKCVVECCMTVMDLLQWTGKSAGADDFFPVLVYVILKANPPNLLSTLQYVNFFGEAQIASGENSYWWTQFCTAVHFIQSIDDRRDLLSPVNKARTAAAKLPQRKSVVLVEASSSDEES